MSLLFALIVFTLAFGLSLLLPPPRGYRWVAAVGVVFALGEWFLAYRRAADRDDGREGLELVLVSGLFAAAFLALWLLGIAAAVLLRRGRDRRAAA